MEELFTPLVPHAHEICVGILLSGAVYLLIAHAISSYNQKDKEPD